MGLNFDQGVHRCEKMSSFRKLRWDFGVQSLPPVTAVVSVRTGITVSVSVVSIRMTVVSVPSISGGISLGFGLSLGFPLPVSAVTAVVSHIVSVTAVSVIAGMSIISIPGISGSIGLRL